MSTKSEAKKAKKVAATATTTNDSFIFERNRRLRAIVRDGFGFLPSEVEGKVSQDLASNVIDRFGGHSKDEVYIRRIMWFATRVLLGIKYADLPHNRKHMEDFIVDVMSPERYCALTDEDFAVVLRICEEMDAAVKEKQNNGEGVGPGHVAWCCMTLLSSCDASFLNVRVALYHPAPARGWS
jgi:hypothetical protein